MRQAFERAIETSVQQLLSRQERIVLAVSGGADSAVLLDIVARFRGASNYVLVASIDHGTGAAATEATALAVSIAARHGLPAISERLSLARHDEASLRNGRWSFLRQVGRRQRATIVTGHSLDDHIETVVMRILRGSSARGMAGLLVESDIERPLLPHRRDDIRAYARSHEIPFVEDPTNRSLSYFRNRVRLELLPALLAVRPSFESDIIDTAQRAAELRHQVDAVAKQFVVERRGDSMYVDALALGELPDESLRTLLPSLTSSSGITLDRRGLIRLAAIVRSRPGTRGQLSGGYEAVRLRDQVQIGLPAEREASVLRLREKGETQFGAFRFRALTGTSIPRNEGPGSDAWRIYLPRSAEPVVRQWHPGDRLTVDSKGGRRKVKRFFADAGVVGPLRIGWPVVLCGDDVIWIPGIKSSQAAIRNEGRMVHYTCERVRG